MNEDKSGVLYALALDEKGGARQVDAARIADSLPVWVHLDFSSQGAQRFLLDQGLEDYIVDTLTRVESRPQSMAVGDGLMIILRGINRNAGADPEDMVSVRIWVQGGRIFTVRQRPVKAAQIARERLEAGHGPVSITDMLLEIITVLADGIAEFIDDVEERIEAYEDNVEEGSTREVRGQLSAIRRQVAAVRRYLAPQREALETLNRLANKLLDAEQLFALRAQTDRVTRYIEDIDLVRERALVTQEELMNRVAQEQNTRTYLFTVVATIFLPITFISGMFGMNTAGLPGLENEDAFWLVSGAMALIALVVIVWLWLKRWF
jgi:zinc transporter